MNAPVAAEHWLNDPQEGGGRILGEACHLFDFANWLCGTPERVVAVAVPPAAGVATPESASVTIQYADGSVATIHYSGLGPGVDAEGASRGAARRQVVGARRLPDADVVRRGRDERGARRGDKGHAELLRGVLAACRGERPFEPGLGAAYWAQSVALAALDSIASGQAMAVEAPPERAV